eukprot:gnl/TRDRNA2_/TRDRNA2_83514_c0_seq1.p1 gnl/TRDRNA2_/TRDRNA2_83514_c0~~gnl/TRDRNA2_/TRDRNA2_83514_c0_seq1.p1  ORF type:complete len:517 (-),score=79.35 gnl/TRDRNA2_/TRDRNA2_83514_c0_seq1:75-1562(-)
MEPLISNSRAAAIADTSDEVRRLQLATTLSLTFMTIEIVGGLFANSLAIITDAMHIFSDAGGFMISSFALKLMQRRATLQYSYGFQQVGTLGALFSVALVWFMAGVLLVQAVNRLRMPEEIDGRLMTIIATIGLCANFALIAVLGVHGHTHGGKPCTGHGHSHGAGGHGEGSCHGHSHGGHGGHGEGGHDHGGGHDCGGHGHGDGGHDGHGDAHSHGGHGGHGGQDADDCCGGHGTSGGHAGDAHSHDAGHSHGGHGGHDADDCCGGHGGGHSHDGADERGSLLEAGSHGHGHGHGHSDGGVAGQRNPSLAMQAAMIHVIGDLVQSVGVMLAGAFIWWRPVDLGTTPTGVSRWCYFDPICTLIFSVLVILTTIDTTRQAVSQVLLSQPDDVDVDELRRSLESIPNVVSVHDMHVWQVGQGVVCTTHVVIKNSDSCTAVLQKCISIAQNKYKIGHSTFQLEVEGQFDHSVENLQIGSISCHDLCESGSSCRHLDAV